MGEVESRRKSCRGLAFQPAAGPEPGFHGIFLVKGSVSANCLRDPSTYSLGVAALE
jgi:hypothetical protein